LGRVVDLETRDPGKVSMYVCGPTPYDVPHIGHGRFALVFDVIRRYLEWSGFEVRYVSNITDIEDKIINRSLEEGRSTEEIVATYTDAWFDAIDRLGVRRPDEVPTATGYVEKIVAYIAELVDRGRAYETPDGVYFSVESLEGYGLLARQPLESLRAGGGERELVGEDHKRHPFDFALWKKAKAGEPAWDSPWEAGRPGWHIECTVMALDLLGDDFDLHGGGEDLCFPHHENERAQALGASHRFARHWLHNGMVVAASGQKMSKSLHNYVSLTDLLATTDGRAYRLLVLRSQYRSPVEVTADSLADATQSLERLDAFARKFAGVVGSVEPDVEVLAEFRRHMDDDFNTPPATAVLFDALRRANRDDDAGAAAAVFDMCRAVGLELRTESGEVDADAEALAVERDQARAARDFARADAIRDQLVGLGWTVEDTSEGTKLRR
jgi:cysteinyl-tRNA synthetase